MVIKINVSEIAKDFGKQNKEIIEVLDQYCEGPAKKAATVLSEDELNILFDKITQATSVESFDSYFAQKKPAEKKESKKTTEKKAEPKKPVEKKAEAKKPTKKSTKKSKK